MTLPLQAILAGPQAFYNEVDYEDKTYRDFSKKETLPISYTWNTEHKVIQFVKQLFLILIFPYTLLHILAGKIILPASTPAFLGIPRDAIDEWRKEIPLNGPWKYKRITVEVDGYKIDAMIVGKASTLNNGTWILASNGNGEFYETQAHDRNLKHILSEFNGNAIVFNYPGVGASSGMPNRQAMAKAYRAMLTLLEDTNKGIGAKKIIGYGHSIGGGVQGDALREHEFKPDIRYAFIKSRTFSDLSSTASHLTCKFLGFLVKVLGWNMDSTESSKTLKAPEIILQTAAVSDYEELTDSSQIIDDGVIPAQTTLAKALLDNPECPRDKKSFIGIPEGHNSSLRRPSYIVRKAESFLREPTTETPSAWQTTLINTGLRISNLHNTHSPEEILLTMDELNITWGSDIRKQVIERYNEHQISEARRLPTEWIERREEILIHPNVDVDSLYNAFMHVTETLTAP